MDQRNIESLYLYFHHRKHHRKLDFLWHKSNNVHVFINLLLFNNLFRNFSEFSFHFPFCTNNNNDNYYLLSIQISETHDLMHISSIHYYHQRHYSKAIQLLFLLLPTSNAKRYEVINCINRWFDCVQRKNWKTTKLKWKSEINAFSYHIFIWKTHSSSFERKKNLKNKKMLW